MSTFMNIFSDEKIMNHPEVKYLYEMVDFSKFLPISAPPHNNNGALIFLYLRSNITGWYPIDSTQLTYVSPSISPLGGATNIFKSNKCF